MLNGPLLHPEILRILAQSGHHSKVLIADGNYPAATKRGPRAELVSLQLMPGVPTVAQVFEALLGAVRIDEVHTMGVDRTDSYAAATPGDPPVWAEYRRILAAAQSPCQLHLRARADREMGLLRGRRLRRPRAHDPDRRHAALGEPPPFPRLPDVCMTAYICVQQRQPGSAEARGALGRRGPPRRDFCRPGDAYESASCSRTVRTSRPSRPEPMI